MKQFNQLFKILFIVVALLGLTVGMSAITGCSTSDDAKTTVQDVNAKEKVDNSKCGEGKCGGGKCGGDEAKTAVSEKTDEVKESVKDSKCGEGKCG